MELGDAKLRAALDDYRVADIDPKLRATLAFIEKMTRTPDELTTEDADRVRAAGVSQRALEDAVAVCATFNVINRVGDALAFRVPSAEVFRKAGKLLWKIGYD